MKVNYIIIVILLFISLSGNAQNALNAEGLRSGPWKGYYPDTTIRYEAFFENGKPVGTLKRYDEAGHLSVSMKYYKGKDRCFAKMYSPNGKVKAQGVYESQYKDSTWIYLGADESVRMIEHYKMGNLTGFAESFYPSGNISRRINYSGNKKDGPWFQFFENGDTMMIAAYKDDALHGKYLSFYPEGKKQMSGEYYEDLRHGSWLYFSEEGDTLSILKYDQGNILNPDELEKSYEKFIKNIEDNLGNTPDPALEGGF